MSKLNLIARGAMRHPLLWGAVATAGFYLALDSGVVEEPLLARYFAGHWAAYVSTTMFLVGAAALVVKALDLARNFRGLGATLFDGVTRNSPEGLWFKAQAEEHGFKAAVRMRDDGEPIAEGRSRPFRASFGNYKP